MNVDLLSKMVRDVILDKDEVSLFGVGSFVAEIVPSTFSDKGYTINPPYRRLFFRQKENPADTSLVDLYCKSNDVDKETAGRILREFFTEMRGMLETKKNVVLPGLGKLRATRENNFFFVADEDLDIYPEGFGLEPISLKTHQETCEEISDKLSELQAIMQAPVTESEPVPVEPAAAPAGQEAVETETASEPSPSVESAPVPSEKSEETCQTTQDQEVPVNQEKNAKEPVESAADAKQIVDADPEPVARPKWPKYLRWGAVITIAVAVTAILAFVALAKLSPDFVDSLLYTPEELEIINY